jgi:hypothetical protein
MKKFLTVVAGLIFLGLVVHGAASDQQSKTGDRKLNSLLGKIDTRAEAEPDVFFQQLSQRHDIPEQEIREAKERNGLGYGDIYMATALSKISRKPVGAVAEDFHQNPGRGWGVMAMNLGIKPGSPEFKQMKANARDSVDRMKTVSKAKKRQHKEEMAREREQNRKNEADARGKGQGKGKKK